MIVPATAPWTGQAPAFSTRSSAAIRRLLGAAIGVLLSSASALAQVPPVNPYNPGSTSSPPGPGCAIGTSGCFPSAPPGPQWIPEDSGATTQDPPSVVDPQDIPFYGSLPGPAGESRELATRPPQDPMGRVEEQREHEERQRQLLEEQLVELQQQREEMKAQTEALQVQIEELAAQREELEALRAQLEERAAEAGEQPAPGGTPGGASSPAP